MLKFDLASVKSFSLKRVVRVTHLERRVLGEGGLGYCRFLRSIYFFITITLVMASHPQLRAQEVTSVAPPAVQQERVPDGPEMVRYPEAKVVADEDGTTPLEITSATQSRVGSKYVLDEDVVLKYKDRVVRADHVEYDSETGDLVATGHLKATGGANHEIITASHGTLNLKTQTGRFYDVTGSVGMKTSGKRMVYVNGNPFLFTGKVVVKTGPQEYEVYGGTVTSCQLPRPDWLLSAGRFSVTEDRATARNSVFRLLNVPLLYLPYVTHPVDSEGRQSGLMLPIIGQSSTKGLVLGEQLYWSINRSMDLTVGAQYYSLRGWEQSATFRYKGLGNDFVTAHYSALLDRGFTPKGGMYTNQGGQDVTFMGRHDFNAQTRVVADVDYLSSYVYREAFTENFNQAVSSDILSTAYGVHSWNGYVGAVRADRYQGLKRVPIGTTPGQQVRIFHAPSLDFSMTDHRVGTSGLLWSVEASAAGLKRSQPNFVSSGIIERFDLHPQVSYPLSGGGWKLRPAVGFRETVYSRSRNTTTLPGPPIELTSAVNRADFEGTIELRAPVLERVFDSRSIERVLRHDVKHTVEPTATYRYVTGVNNFLSVLRFDDADIVTNTNEMEYGVTQRVYLKPLKTKDCVEPVAGAGDAAGMKAAAGFDAALPSDTATSKCSGREWISWRLTQKYFFDHKFGGTVVSGRRNIFDTTLNLSGIAFLTEPRDISPLISRLRLRTSERLDVEWDFDLDTGAKKFTSNNVLIDLHEGNKFAGLSYARLNAPGRFYSQGISSATSDFSQLRILLGYGNPVKKGLSVAANAGLDLNLSSVQYGALQTSYNWNCCGLSVEYRKYELGSVRNENAYRFNFTLANIGTAGNLRRAERLF